MLLRIARQSAAHLNSLLQCPSRLHRGFGIVAQCGLDALAANLLVDGRLNVLDLLVDNGLALHVKDDPRKLEDLLLLRLIDVGARRHLHGT